MGSITKRGQAYRAQVKRGPKRITRTFRTKAGARAWIAQQETEAAQLRDGIPRKRVGEMFARYALEVSPTKKGARWEAIRLQKLQRDPIADVWAADLKPRHVAEWRDRQTLAPSSINREWNLLSAVFNAAVKEWHWLHSNPCKGVRRPGTGKARDRRPTEDELSRLDLALSGTDLRNGVRLAMWFAIETAMRAGEIASLRPGDVVGRVAHLSDTKNGHARDVPLSRRALELWEEAGQFPTSMQISQRFAAACKTCQIEGLTFHDLRREALSRLAKKVDVMTLAKISGHRDVRVLMNVYYKPDIEELAELLD